MATIESLQEQALQLEIDIYRDTDDGETEPLNADELTAAIEARTAELKAEAEAEAAAADAARKSAAEEKKAEAARKRAKARAAAKAAAAAPAPNDVAAAYGLGSVTKADRELARKHGYPVAIPGAVPFKISTSLNCGYGGGLRPAGSVMLLTAEHAANKHPYLTPIE